MGKLIKNHLARLLTLTASLYTLLGAIHCIFWPKLLFDFSTLNLNHLVKPVPYLQILTIVLSLAVLAWEWPLGFVGRLRLHSSIEMRLVGYPGMAVVGGLMYQGGWEGCVWWLIVVGVWGWAYVEGEVVCSVPWTLPKKKKVERKVEA